MALCSELPEPESLKCPRCNSRETKFCYYNNYSTTQPRHFCRNCKRYWTAGGSLRNVPVGGGLRKNKKSKLSKHLKEMLSGSSDEIFSPGNPTPLLLASPSSSADGIVDETLSNPAIPLCVYRPCYESVAESLVTGDCTPSLAPMNSRNFAHQSDGCGHVLLTDGHQQHAYDAFHGIHQPQLGFGCVDQGQFNSGKILSEPSHASHKATELTAVLYPRYPVLQQQAHGVPTGLRQNESRNFNKQGNLQYSAEENGFSDMNRNMSSAEDEDEGLGNVINVGYPYDWEQVSEVLCVETPDFFQIPTF